MGTASELAPKIGFVMDGWLRKVGRLRKPAVDSAHDVLGFDCLVHSVDGRCYQFYAANPPLIGLSTPEPVACPIGLETFGHFKVGLDEAVKRFHHGDWGGEFTSIELYKPMAKDAVLAWHFISSLGVHVVIPADSDEKPRKVDEPASALTPGGWTPFGPLSEADKKVFNTAIKGLTGVNYEPRVVARQVVAGMNYDYLCKATPVVPDPNPYAAHVAIFAPLQGPPYVKWITPEE